MQTLHVKSFQAWLRNEVQKERKGDVESIANHYKRKLKSVLFCFDLYGFVGGPKLCFHRFLDPKTFIPFPPVLLALFFFASSILESGCNGNGCPCDTDYKPAPHMGSELQSVNAFMLF